MEREKVFNSPRKALRYAKQHNLKVRRERRIGEYKNRLIWRTVYIVY